MSDEILLNQIKQLFETKLSEVKKELKDGFDVLKDGFDVLKDGFDVLKDGQDALKKDIAKVDQTVGDLVELQLRPLIARMQGDHFARELTFETLEDVVVFVLGDMRLGIRDILKESKVLAQHLVDTKVAEEFLRKVYDAIMFVNADIFLGQLRSALTRFPWIDEHDALDNSKLGEFIGEVQSKHGHEKQHKWLIKLLGWILRYLGFPTDEDKCTYLLSPAGDGSLGMLLALFKSSPQLYVPPTPSEYKDFTLPAGKLQCDVVGSVAVYKTKAIIQTGEIKRSDSYYGEGAQQLMKRLALFEWAVRTVRPNIHTVVKTGHLYFPKGGITGRMPRDRFHERVDGIIQTHYL